MQQAETAVIYSDDADTQAMIDLLLSRRQQVVKFATQRPLKVRKNQEPIVKHSVFTAIIGQVYDEIAEVIAKRASGELPAENQGLPRGEWAVFPYIIAHKGEYYVRCTVDSEGQRLAPRFTRGGSEITRSEAEAAALASEFRSGDDSPIFNIKLSSIITAE
jgi:hypothetical protein